MASLSDNANLRGFCLFVCNIVYMSNQQKNPLQYAILSRYTDLMNNMRWCMAIVLFAINSPDYS